MSPSKVLTTFPLQIQRSWHLLLLELPPCQITVTPSSDSSDMYTPLYNLALSLLTLLSLAPPSSPNLLSPICPFYIFSLCPLTIVPCSWLSFCLHSPLTLSGFFNGMLEVFEPGALNYSTFSRPILLTLSAFRNPILTHFPLSGFLDFLLYILIVPTPGMAFSLLIPCTLAAALSFSSGRAYLFLNFLPPLFLRSIPTLIM